MTSRNEKLFYRMREGNVCQHCRKLTKADDSEIFSSLMKACSMKFSFCSCLLERALHYCWETYSSSLGSTYLGTIFCLRLLSKCFLAPTETFLLLFSDSFSLSMRNSLIYILKSTTLFCFLSPLQSVYESFTNTLKCEEKFPFFDVLFKQSFSSEELN